MTLADRMKLDAICKEAFARLDAMDERMYHLGWLRDERKKPANKMPMAAPGAGKRFGNPNSTELKREPVPMLPSGGEHAM